MTTYKRNDNWPPLRFRCADQNGAMPLGNASAIRILFRSGGTVIAGTATAIDPPDSDGFNGSYTLSSETATVGSYAVEVEINWGNGRIQTVPNSSTEELTIEADLG